MAPVVVGIICALISFVIAAGTIGREAHRLDSFSPVPVYDVERAVAFVADALPEDVSARVSFWDVRSILDASRSDHDRYGLSQESLVVKGPKLVVEELVVVSPDRTDRIADLAIQSNPELSRVDVDMVLAAELEYLRTIGAIGPRAEYPE
jgi:hypothetical protein